LLLIFDLQTQIGVLRLAVQKHGINFDDLEASREELERRLNFHEWRSQLQALGVEALLKTLRDFEGPIQ